MEQQILPMSILPFDINIIAGVIKPASEAMYRRDMFAYLDFAQTREIALKPSTLARWRAYLVNETNKSPNTINRMLSAVRSLMDTAAEQEYITYEIANSFKSVRGVKINALEDRQKEHAQTKISNDDMRRMTDAPDTNTLVGLRDKALLHTLATSGIRASEAAKLTIDRIGRDGNNYYVEIKGKNDEKYRRASLTKEAFDAIQSWLSARENKITAVFTGFKNQSLQSTGKALSPVSVWRIVQKYARQCDLDWIKPHDFRRYMVTQVTKKHGLRKAQQAAGHKRIGTTEKYDLSELELGLTNNLY